MKRLLLIITLLVMLLPGLALAGETLRKDVVLTPGDPWHLIVERLDDAGGPVDTRQQIYMAMFTAAPPLQPVVYARFLVEPSQVDPGKMVVRISGRQTRALAGLKGVWMFTYLPDLGPQTYNIIHGSMEVKP